MSDIPLTGKIKKMFNYKGVDFLCNLMKANNLKTRRRTWTLDGSRQRTSAALDSEGADYSGGLQNDAPKEQWKARHPWIPAKFVIAFLSPPITPLTTK